MKEITESQILEDARKSGLSLPYNLVELCLNGQFLPSESLTAALKRQEQEIAEDERQERLTQAKQKSKDKECKRLSAKFTALSK
jgi:hypothetical protein